MTMLPISTSFTTTCFYVCLWLIISQSEGSCAESFPTITYNGYCYATISGANPSGTTPGCDSAGYSMPNGGWDLADDSADSDYVAVSYPWSTHVLVYGTTDAHACHGSSIWNHDCGSGIYSFTYSSGIYGTNDCNLRVLIKRNIIPTSDPTTQPTLNPTVNCDEQEEIKYIDWYQLQNSVDNQDQIPHSNLTMTFDPNSLELTFDIDLEYIGLATNDDIDKTFDLPTSYVIDFQPFGISGSLINQPGNCQNRLSSSFNGITDFNQFWGYSEYPFAENHIGSNTFLSYPPPSQYWTLSIEENACSPIKYNGVFNWNDLAQCTDFNGSSLVNIVDNDESITLYGTLYISVVSPFYASLSPASDSGFYNVFSIASKEFALSVNKQSNVLSEGVDLFMASIIGIHQDVSAGSYKLSVLTKSADYMTLTNPSIMSSPYGTDMDITEVTTSCLVASSFTCGQIFTISINRSLVNCPPASFVGDYNMGFTVNCPGNDEPCTTFISDNGGSAVALSVTSNFVDNDCESKMYDIIFEGIMSFYGDAAFQTTHDEAYIVSKDPIYVQIEVNLPEDGIGNDLNIFGVEIDNVFVCTAADDVDLTVNLDQQNGNGGCLSSEIDDDGPYDIIVNGVEDALYGSSIISNGDVESNMVQFSFLPFDLGRTRVYIHAQITLVLQNGQRRRLQITNSNDGTTSNQIRHFMGSVFVEAAPTTTTTTTSSVFVNNKDKVTKTTVIKGANPEQEGEGGEGGEGDEDESNDAQKLRIVHVLLGLTLFVLFFLS